MILLRLTYNLVVILNICLVSQVLPQNEAEMARILLEETK